MDRPRRHDSDVDDPRAELELALSLANETEQKLAVASLIDELIRDLGFRAIVMIELSNGRASRSCSRPKTC